MHLKLPARVFLIPFLVAACAPRMFLTNEPIDARSVHTSLAVQPVEAENKVFRVYKINNSLYALVPALYSATNSIDELNRALILSADQRDSLVATASRISAAFDRRAQSGTTIIGIELIRNSTEVLTRSSSVGTASIFQTSGSSVEVNRIVFRLQYADEGQSRFKSGQRIDYMMFTSAGSLGIADLRALIRDLSK